MTTYGQAIEAPLPALSCPARVTEKVPGAVVTPLAETLALLGPEIASATAALSVALSPTVNVGLVWLHVSVGGERSTSNPVAVS